MISTDLHEVVPMYVNGGWGPKALMKALEVLEERGENSFWFKCPKLLYML